jgi:hypothetical protein
LKNSKLEYEKRKKYYEDNIEKQTKDINLISYLRLATFVIGFGTSIYLYVKKSYYIGSAIFVLALIMFIYLIYKHSLVIKERKYALIMRDINHNSIERLNGDWKFFKDTGVEFNEEDHNYAGDLDIFGKGSVFQWINAAVTYTGRLRLRDMLSSPCRNKEQITKRQQAVEELEGKVSWRQELMAEAIVVSDKLQDPKKLVKWCKEKKEFYSNHWGPILFRIIPAAAIMIIVLSFTGTVPRYWRSIVICIQILLLLPGYAERAASLGTIYEHKDSIRTYEGLIRLIEKGEFDAHYLKELQGRLINSSYETASMQIKKLMKISDRISDRSNFFFIVLNILLLLDYQFMFSLEKWKRNSGDEIEKWIETIGELEALSSLAIIKCDNPDWSIPQIEEEGSFLEGEQIGHPLLADKRVCNDLCIGKNSTVLLITGSNMSGKSTLLRTAGINLVLAYAGAPVCAKAFKCSIMDVYTCMRISDNLEKSISSFYAEIIRIKLIVNAVKQKKQIFFLLDEIFKGTNSLDRHMGAEILIKQLDKEGAIGMVSTHDLELGEMEKGSSGRIRNYHFREYYKNGELNFDYKLREGISTTRNAMYLIKMAGIEMEEQDF